MLDDAHIQDAADAGPRATGNERLCVATRSVRPVGEMIRFVAGPDGVLPDLKRKLPGRGVWVTGERSAVTSAVKTGAFKRSLKGDVKVPPDLADLTERLLLRSVLDALSIAFKAREVVTGFGKVEAVAGAPTLRALIHAAEAADDGVAKLGAALKRRGEGAEIPVIRTLTSAQLDLALGRPNVVHAALLAGRAGDTFLARWQDLERYRTGNDRGRTGNDAGEPSTAAVEPGL